MIVGQQLGPFAVEKELGSGAMGTVYLARYAKTGQRVAIKVLAPGLGANETSLARFEREAAILKRLHHPNIVRFFGAGRFQGAPFYAMEFVQGESLDHIMERRGRIGWEQVVAWAKQLCAALQHAHEQGVIHRDLKPANLMVLANDTLKLSDFGIAKDLELATLTSTNTTVGTAAYMSPEQCRGERNLTPKADLYCLGVVLYELLTGTKPFHADTTMGMLMQHVRGKFERPARIVLEIPPWLDTLVCQLLEKKPEYRPRDAAIVAEALDHGLEKITAEHALAGGSAAKATPGQETSVTGADGSHTEVRRGKKRRKQRAPRIYERGWFVSAAVVSLLVAAGVGSWFLFFKPPSSEGLYREAEGLMASRNPEVRQRARDGPIQAYLDHYGDRQNERTAKILAWADEVDLPLWEKQLANRFNRRMVDGEDEPIAHEAVRQEEAGDLEAARQQWQKLLKHKGETDRKQRSWGQLAVKRLRDLQEASEREQELRRKIDKARKTGEQVIVSSDWDPRVGDAMRHEVAENFEKAQDLWKELKEKYKKPDQRPWFLLAARKAKELANKPARANKENGTDPRPQP